MIIIIINCNPNLTHLKNVAFEFLPQIRFNDANLLSCSIHILSHSAAVFLQWQLLPSCGYKNTLTINYYVLIEMRMKLNNYLIHILTVKGFNGDFKDVSYLGALKVTMT